MNRLTQERARRVIDRFARGSERAWPRVWRLAERAPKGSELARSLYNLAGAIREQWFLVYQWELGHGPGDAAYDYHVRFVNDLLDGLPSESEVQS